MTHEVYFKICHAKSLHDITRQLGRVNHYFTLKFILEFMNHSGYILNKIKVKNLEDDLSSARMHIYGLDTCNIIYTSIHTPRDICIKLKFKSSSIKYKSIFVGIDREPCKKGLNIRWDSKVDGKWYINYS